MKTKPKSIKSVQKKSSKFKKNGLHKDIVVLEEKPYKPRINRFFFFSLLIFAAFFGLIILIKQIPSYYLEVFLSDEGIKTILSIVLLIVAIGIKYYFNHKLKEKLNLKL